MTLEEIWRRKEDEEVFSAAERLDNYTDISRQVILAEVERRRMPAYRAEQEELERRFLESTVLFTPAGSVALWTKTMLIAVLALTVVGIVSGLLQIDLISRATTGDISNAEIVANDSRQQLIGVLQLILFLGTGFTFLIWFHRTHRNLPSLGGRELKYTPGWAVGGFCIPFLNLVRPLQVMREVWHGSDPSGLDRDTAATGPSIRNRLGTPPLVGWWWALFLVSRFLGNIIDRTAFVPNGTLDQFQSFSYLLVFTDLVNVPSVLVALRLVSRVSSWQAERIELVQQRGGVSPPTLPGYPSSAI